MRTRTKLIVAGLAVAGSVAAGTGIAVAGSGDDDATEVPITGADLQKASMAALAQTGEGRVTGTEVGDEDSRYEVEVTLDDGRRVDVQLDASFGIVSVKADRDGEGGDD